jgi:uncharacterized protein (DUF433 family)
MSPFVFFVPWPRLDFVGAAGYSDRKEASMNPLLERISVDPDFFFGKSHIRGQRVWVSTILDLLAGGMSMSEVLKVYPTIEELDILAAIAYGADMSRDRPVAIADVLRSGPQCRRRRPPPADKPCPSDSRIAG